MDLELLSAITELFERQDAKLEERLSKQDSKLDKLDERFSKQDSKLDKLDERLSKQESKLDKLDERLSKQESKLDKFDERLSKQESKLDKFDERLSKQDSRFDKLDERFSKQDSKLDKLQINQEAGIIPKIELLFEGHKGLADQIERVAPPENIQDRVETLEAAVKYLSSELNRLKKAE